MDIKTGRNRLVVPISRELLNGDTADRDFIIERAKFYLKEEIKHELFFGLSDGRRYHVQVSPAVFGGFQLVQYVTVLLIDWQDALVGEATVGEPCCADGNAIRVHTRRADSDNRERYFTRERSSETFYDTFWTRSVYLPYSRPEG